MCVVVCLPELFKFSKGKGSVSICVHLLDAFAHLGLLEWVDILQAIWPLVWRDREQELDALPDGDGTVLVDIKEAECLVQG